MRFFLCLLAVVGVFGRGFAVSVEDASAVFGQDLDVIELADRLGYWRYLVALEETGLTDLVRATNPITLFIPTNQAVQSLPQAAVDAWTKDAALYKQFVSYHVVQGAFKAENLVNDEVYPTLAGMGAKARVNIYNHTAASKLTQKFTYMGVDITATNYMATNGIIHVINAVVPEIQTETILKNVQDSADLSLFFNATQNVPLFAAMLNGSETFTLFAPSNTAIAAANQTIWEAIVKNQTLLADTLSAHLLAGTYYSNGFEDGDRLPSENANATLTINIRSDPATVFVNKVTVTEANNAALNGVIHVVDGLLWLPKLSDEDLS